MAIFAGIALWEIPARALLENERCRSRAEAQKLLQTIVDNHQKGLVNERNMKIATRLQLICLFLLIPLAGAVCAQTPPLKKIRIGYPSLSFRQSNVWVAREVGLFTKYGLEVEPIFLRGGQMATQALVAGDPPIVNIGTVVQASLQGYNLVLVAAVETKYDQIVFARKGINKLEELKGKKIRHQRLRLGDP